jgi:hypothetical protein
MDLESLLMALSRGRQFGELDPTNVLHMVTIRARDRNLEGAFDPAGAVGQKAWWVLMDRNRGYQDSSRVSVRGAADLVDGQAPLRVHANLMRRDTRAEPTHPHNWPEIVAVCAAWTHGQPDIRATATRSIGAGTIGPARVGPYNAAILAPNAPIGPGVVVCQPIHKVDSKIWFPSGQEVLSRMWFHLQRLPLLVPEVGATCPPQPAPSVSAGGHTPEP